MFAGGARARRDAGLDGGWAPPFDLLQAVPLGCAGTPTSEPSLLLHFRRQSPAIAVLGDSATCRFEWKADVDDLGEWDANDSSSSRDWDGFPVFTLYIAYERRVLSC
jgi:hypothetical protein